MSSARSPNITTSNTEYLGGFQYNNGVLQYIPTAEGYVKNTVVNGVNTYDYIFNYTDHLGNIRLSYGIAPVTQLLTIFEENNYYPFGMKHATYNYQLKTIENLKDVPSLNTTSDSKAAVPIDPDPIGNLQIIKNSGYQYKFNGKELQDELGLGVYDYGARMYDPAGGPQFWQVDPLAEEFPDTSPYAFVNNNPLRFTDPTGMSAEDVMPPDDYLIKQNGTIEVTKTNDKFDRFSIENKQGKIESITQINKNENGLLQLPSSINFNSSDSNSSFSLSVKEGNEYRSYIRGDAAAALFGAASQANFKDIGVVGFSLSDGKSPAPSTSHKLGKNGDLRYLNTNEKSASTNIRSSNFDVTRQSAFNEALFKYGWRDMISERFGNGNLLPHTSSSIERKIHSDHTTHLHLQGFNPKLIKK